MLAQKMKGPLFSRLLESRGICFFAGILTVPLVIALFLLIDFFHAPSPTEAMIQITGRSPDFREVKEILDGRYYYSLEFSGDIDSFHAFAKLLSFPGRLESSTRYYHLTPDYDQRISITFENGKLLYVNDST